MHSLARRVCPCVVVIAGLWAFGSTADVGADPIAAGQLIPLQAALLSQGGGAVADGKYVVFFKLYDAVDSLEPLWQEVQPEVAVSLGRLATFLGAADGKGVPEALFAAGAPLWLGVRVGSEPELPRVQIGVVPFALHARRAALADALACSGCVAADQIAAGAIGSDHLGTNSVQSKHVEFTYAGSDSKGGAALSAKVAGQAALADLAAKADLATVADEAYSLQCSGCVTSQMLHADALAAYTATTALAKVALSGAYADLTGGPDLTPYAKLNVANTFAAEQQLVGGVDLALSQARRMRLENSEVEPAKCEEKTSGLIYYNPVEHALYVCNGSAFTAISLVAVGTQAHPGKSCADILKLAPTSKDGVFWVDADGEGGVAAFQVFCDMTTDEGGWTLIARYRFQDGPNLFAGNMALDGTAWRQDAGIGDLASGSFAHDISKFVDSGMIAAKSAFAVRSGSLVAKGTGFSWLPKPLPESAPHHTRQGEVTLDGKTYTITSACYHGCCGTHTDTWDTLVFMQNYSAGSGDIYTSGDSNMPFIGWGDHACNVDGHDTTPAWNMVGGGKSDPKQRFAADVTVMFR